MNKLLVMGPKNEKAEVENCCLEKAKTGTVLLLRVGMTNLITRTSSIMCFSTVLFLT